MVRYLQRRAHRISKVNTNRLRILIRFPIRGDKFGRDLTVIRHTVSLGNHSVLPWNDGLFLLSFASFSLQMRRVSICTFRARRAVNGDAPHVAKDDGRGVSLLLTLFLSGMSRRAHRRTATRVLGNGHQAVRRLGQVGVLYRPSRESVRARYIVGGLFRHVNEGVLTGRDVYRTVNCLLGTRYVSTVMGLL